jgi:hypothetical protein
VGVGEVRAGSGTAESLRAVRIGAPAGAMVRENRSVERNWERARPFAELSIEDLEGRVGAFFPGARVLLAERQTRGLRNSNYRLTVAGAPSPLAFRLYVADPSACSREAAVLAEVRDRAPVPRVFATDTAADPPFALADWIEGEPLDDVLRDCDAATELQLATACGTVLAAIHQTRFAASGFLAARGLELSPRAGLRRRFRGGLPRSRRLAAHGLAPPGSARRPGQPAPAARMVGRGCCGRSPAPGERIHRRRRALALRLPSRAAEAAVSGSVAAYRRGLAWRRGSCSPPMAGSSPRRAARRSRR